MTRSIRWMFAAAVCCLLFTSIGRSQDQLLDELYGRGVHNYFARNYTQAHTFLTEAITGGSQDPRVYYFRALAYSKLGRPEEAKADFEKGAAFEVQLGDIYPIGRSLERVQGPDRSALESYRRNARLLARGNTNKREATRFEEMKRNEADVLRNPAARGGVVPPAAGPAAVAPAASDPFGAAPADPFGGAGGAAPAPAPAPMPAPAAGGADPFGAAPAPGPAPMPAPAPAVADPFGAAPAPAPMPAPAPAADPFGAAPAPGPAPMPAPAPAPAPAADPFGAATPAVPADPFGAGVAPAPAPGVAAAPAVTGGKSTIGSLFRAFTKAIPGEAGDQPAGAGPAPIIDPAVRPADAQNDPFKDDPAAPPGPPGPPRPVRPAAPVAPAGDGAADPFGAAPAPAPAPAAPVAPAVDPFGAAPAPAPAPAAPVAPAADPFGAPEAPNKPEPPATPAPAADPFG